MADVYDMKTGQLCKCCTKSKFWKGVGDFPRGDGNYDKGDVCLDCGGVPTTEVITDFTFAMEPDDEVA